MKPFRKGETQDVVEAVEKHFDVVDELVEQFRIRRISWKDVASLLDPLVADYLKHVGLEERIFQEVLRQFEELGKRHELFSSLYKRFSWY